MIQWIRSLDRVLKGEATRPATLRGGTIELPIVGLTVLLVLLGGLYGACMGTFALLTHWGTPTASRGFLQMGFSAVKVPMLFVLTLTITFPSLYVFNALVGCRLAFSTVMRLLIAALGVTLAVLASFGTIVVFFSLCTTSYSFMVLLNVAMFAVAGLLGMNFLLQTLHRLAIARAMAAWEQLPVSTVETTSPAQSRRPENESPGSIPPPLLPANPSDPGAIDHAYGPTPGRNVRAIFSVWVIVFGLIGAQMGWVLRPFIGKPDAPVTFFRPREGNFFQAVAGRVEDLVFEQKPRSGSDAAPANTRNWNSQ
jgi:hypothetical protein